MHPFWCLTVVSELEAVFGTGHRLALRAPSKEAPVVCSIQALVVAGALALTGLIATPGWTRTPSEPTPALVSSVPARAVAPVPVGLAAIVTPAVVADDVVTVEPRVQLSSLSQVVRGSLKLTGPQPRPGPIETLN